MNHVPQDWGTYVQSLGFPSAVLAVGIYLAMRGAAWFAREVLRPLLAEHMAFLQVLKEAIRDQAQTLQAISETLDQLVIQGRVRPGDSARPDRPSPGGGP